MTLQAPRWHDTWFPETYGNDPRHVAKKGNIKNNATSATYPTWPQKPRRSPGYAVASDMSPATTIETGFPEQSDRNG